MFYKLIEKIILQLKKQQSVYKYKHELKSI